jgi:hypothetical protein
VPLYFLFLFLEFKSRKRAQVFEPKLRTPCLTVARTCTEASPAYLIEPRLCAAAISAPPRFVFRTSFGEQHRREMETGGAIFKPVRQNGSG